MVCEGAHRCTPQHASSCYLSEKTKTGYQFVGAPPRSPQTGGEPVDNNTVCGIALTDLGSTPTPLGMPFTKGGDGLTTTLKIHQQNKRLPCPRDLRDVLENN